MQSVRCSSKIPDRYLSKALISVPKQVCRFDSLMIAPASMQTPDGSVFDTLTARFRPSLLIHCKEESNHEVNEKHDNRENRNA